MLTSLRFSIFYGWYILAACFFLLFFQAGARFSFGIMFKPMMTQLGWDRASISLVFFLNMIFFALTLSIAGKMIAATHLHELIFFITNAPALNYCINSWSYGSIRA